MSRSTTAAGVLETVRAAIEKYDLISDGDKIIVALSGGADSVTLLSVLISLKEKYNLTLCAAHLNHGIRGAEADNDEKFCKILCENYNTELFVKHIDVPKLSREQKISEELCGRNERYRFFDELSGRLDAKVATAHTASDNAETLLFNLSRGSGISGASGIPPKRGNIIRPLIGLTRDEIEVYCGERALAYVTDSTNLCDEYTRNKIRHNAVPALKSVNPNAEKAMLEFSRDCSELSGFINDCAENALISAKEKYGYSAEALLKENPVVLKAAIAKLCSGNNCERRHIELIVSILKEGGTVELKNIKAVCTQNTLRIIPKESECNSISLTFDCKMSFEFNGKTVEADADFTKLTKPYPVFRTRRSGDTFTYCKRNVTKPIRKAMNESKLPSELRDGLLILAQGSTVLWCEGLGLSKQGKEPDIEIIIR